MWVRFKKLLLQCPTDGVSGNSLFQYFYCTLDSVNNGVADHLVHGGLMRQLYDLVALLLDDMTKVNQELHAREDQMPLLQVGLRKEQIKKDHERDENIAKIITQNDLLSKHVMGGGTRSVNAVGTNSG